MTQTEYAVYCERKRLNQLIHAFMEEDIKSRLDAQDKKLDAIYVSVEKTRKYFLWTLVATIIAFILPIIGIAIILPMVFGPLMSAYSI